MILAIKFAMRGIASKAEIGHFVGYLRQGVAAVDAVLFLGCGFLGLDNDAG